VAKIALYMYPASCSRVTLSALEEIGVEYEDRPVNLGGGAQFGVEYLALNRKSKVPMLDVGGKTLTENAAILAYLDRAYPAAALLPHSEDLLEATRGLSDLVWCSSTLHPMVRQVRAPQKWTTGDPTDIRIDGIQKFGKECAYISQRVAGEGWWYGKHWSIIDVYVYWAYSTAAVGGFPLRDYPQLLAHTERVRGRASFQRALAREVAAVKRAGLPLDVAAL
jgi:glutathione S-transferase